MQALLLALAVVTQPGLADSVTPGVKITRVKPMRGAVQVSIAVRDYIIDASDATNPATEYNIGRQRDGLGHYHIYMTKLQRRGGISRTFPVTTGFSGATNDTTVTVTKVGGLPLEAGFYKLIVVLEHSDHTQRIKASPRDFPPVDFALVRVLPPKKK